MRPSGVLCLFERWPHSSVDKLRIVLNLKRARTICPSLVVKCPKRTACECGFQERNEHVHPSRFKAAYTQVAHALHTQKVLLNSLYCARKLFARSLLEWLNRKFAVSEQKRIVPSAGVHSPCPSYKDAYRRKLRRVTTSFARWRIELKMSSFRMTQETEGVFEILSNLRSPLKLEPTLPPYSGKHLSSG